ncbi:MAG: MarR family transcriptional regulator [Xanthobacteraceae bacterium]|jgi:DNA-binding MarR family transcriptional regulator|nr:MarR family transcriptional regulator [Xanthobacteraceae bacterium]
MDDPFQPGKRVVTAEDYAALAAFRRALRRFMAFSEEAARAGGLTAQQHQAILAIRGHKDGEPLTIGELAEHLLLRHHSAVELVDRLAKAELVTRVPAEHDRRAVLVGLTPRAEGILEELSAIHLDELRRGSGLLTQLLERLAQP